jgi:hypothetical protein
MELDPDIHIVMHSILSLKLGATAEEMAAEDWSRLGRGEGGGGEWGCRGGERRTRDKIQVTVRSYYELAVITILT